MSWKPTRLRAGRGFARKLVQGAGQIAAGQAEQRHEARRQPAAIVEEVVDRIADIELIDGQGRCGGPAAVPAWRRRRWPRRWNELGGQVEHRSVAAIAQARLEVGRQADGGECVECAGAPSGGGQNGVAALDKAARREVGLDGASKRGCAAHISGRGGRGIDLHDVERAGLEREIARDRHRARRVLSGRARRCRQLLIWLFPTVPMPPSSAAATHGGQR